MKRTSRALLFLLLVIGMLLGSASMMADSRAAEKREREREKKKEKARIERQLKSAAQRASVKPKRATQGEVRDVRGNDDGAVDIPFDFDPTPVGITMYKGGSSSTDLRQLPPIRPTLKERDEREEPESPLIELDLPTVDGGVQSDSFVPRVVVNAPMPSPAANFLGLDFLNWGAGRPPDTVGDVGPNHYIQAVNTSIGIYAKTGGAPIAAFTFDTFMSQGSFGNLCDTDNFGDPVILYDTFEDRWVITDFAFQLNGAGDVVNPPGAYQCFAVSKTGDPVAGGWNFYSLHITDNLNDYPKFGIWPDGIYMSSNMFGFPASGTFQGTRVWAFNKAQMYAGAPTVQVVQFSPPVADFTLLPANARLQTGSPPLGSPNYFSTVFNFTNVVSIYKFHVDWTSIALSTFTGPTLVIVPASWASPPATAAAQGGNANDTLPLRLMMQNQYTNIGGVESVWNSHTVKNPAVNFAAPRWYQVTVTGGTVVPNTTQAATHVPDNTIHRYMSSLAVDRAGDMAIGYSASSSTLMPAIRYAGRLAGDAVNALPQTETTLVAGTGSQNTSNRWGDYSAMSLDPDGCTFWFTNEYYITTGNNWQTRVGSFAFPSCTPVTPGTLEGTVTVNPGGAPISGATIQFGARSTTTNASGFYQFTSIPAGTYPSLTASKPGFVTGSTTNIVITGGATTVKDFALSAAPTTACLTDTTGPEFLTGTPSNTDVFTSAGDVILLAPSSINQQATTATSGFGFTNTAWAGQTFTPSVTGQITQVDLSMFCSGCTGTSPSVTVAIRNAAGNLPTGADLGTATISSFTSGGGTFYNAFFSPAIPVVSGTQYAIVFRGNGIPSAGTYAYSTSAAATSSYAGGRRVTSADNGGTWTGQTNDTAFKVYIKTTYSTPGDFVSALKDANPAGGITPIWSNMTWNATVPANTTLQFQVAGSNNAAGPFNFVGPDTTAGTFFTTSPATLSQFYNQRYLRYKAYLATTNNTITPTVNDVTMCFSDVDCSGATPTITPTPSQVCTNSAGNTASGSAGMTQYQWGISNGTITSATNGQSITYTAGASGSVTLTLAIITPAGCHASNNAIISINPIPPTPTVTPSGATTFCAGGSVTLTSSSASGNQWYDGVTLLAGQTNQTYVATTSGNYNVVVTTSGCSSAPSSSVAVTVNPAPPTPTVTPSGATTFCTGGSVTLTSSSATGNQWYDGVTLLVGQTNQTYIATTSGSYNVIVTASGCPSAPSASTVVTVNPIPPTPTVTPSGATTFCAGGSVTLTSSSATGNQWYDGVTLLAGQTNQTYVATTSGNYNVIVTTSGCSSAPSASTVVTVNPAPPTPTVTPSGATTFCAGGSVTLTSSSATGNQWYDGVTLLAGQTNQTYIATTSGSYNVIVTQSGCPSAPSASTVVTVNPIPPTPTVTPSGATTFCAGGSVTLTSSSASGNQWYDGVTLLVGQTNQTYVATTSGNYNVIVTTSGCSSAASASTAVTVNPAPPTPTVTPSGATTFCTGGSVTLTSSSATGNQWYDGVTLLAGQTNQTYIATTSGSYNVIVTASGCPSAPSASTVVTVNPIPPTPTVTPSGATTFCTGGSVTLTSSSATGNQWYDGVTLLVGQTNQTYVATTSGNYNVIVTASGCSSAASASTAVTVNPIPPTPTVTPSGATTFCAGGSVTLTSSSATGNQWYDGVTLLVGQTNQTYVATASGNYNVVVTTSGCSSAPSSSVAVTVNPTPPTPTVTPSGATTFCTGGSVTLTSSSATGNQWYDGASLLAGQTNQTYVATTNGNYNVIVTASGCPSAPSASTAVTVNPIPATPTVTPSGATTFCAGGSVTLTSSSASGNQWYDGVTLLAGQTNQTYVATTNGNYNVVVTTSGCSSAASASTAVTVNPAPPTPTVTPSGATTFCAGGSVTLTSSSATGNQWYDGASLLAGEINQTYVATTSGNYNVIVTQSGCPSAPSASTAVTVNPIPPTPTVTPGGATTFCAGGSVTLTSSSASGNQWYDGVTLLAGQTNQTYVATTNGNYNVVITTSGCSSAPSSSVAVTVNPAPPTPTATPGGATTFCAGGSVTLTSSSATGNQWYDGASLLAGETNQTYVATTSGNYNVIVTASGCPSAPSSSVAVTVNPIPATPTATPGGATTFCTGGSVTLTSSSATGNQWYLNGNPIGGETNQTYVATASGNYTVLVTASGCSSAPSSTVVVTVNPIPATPTITPSGATTFCAGGSVTLTSSSATGNQWLLNGNPIGGETNQTYVATASGDYTVTVTASGCASNASATTTVTVNPLPSSTITAPSSLQSGASSTASVPNAGVGATYAWSITGGTLDSGQNTNSIGFTAGAPGTLTINVTVTAATTCSASGSTNVNVTTVPPAVIVTNVSPATGSDLGGTSVTITGTGFQSGASVTFAANAATSVVVVNSTTITAVTPAHAAGAVNVTVTNTDTTSGTLVNGYTYVAQHFDANGDGVIDPADIFYLVNYLFSGGPAPAGPGGLMSGDANGDNVVDPADIFYLINYLFLGGPAPAAIDEPFRGTRLTGAVSLGRPVVRDGHTFVPVAVRAGTDSIAPRALALRLRLEGAGHIVAVRRSGTMKEVQPTFEVTRGMTSGVAYLVAVGPRERALGGVIAEIEIDGASASRLAIDPSLTMLTDVSGRHQATVANGALQLGAPVAIERETTKERAQ